MSKQTDWIQLGGEHSNLFVCRGHSGLVYLEERDTSGAVMRLCEDKMRDLRDLLNQWYPPESRKPAELVKPEED